MSRVLFRLAVAVVLPIYLLVGVLEGIAGGWAEWRHDLKGPGR